RRQWKNVTSTKRNSSNWLPLATNFPPAHANCKRMEKSSAHKAGFRPPVQESKAAPVSAAGTLPYAALCFLTLPYASLRCPMPPYAALCRAGLRSPLGLLLAIMSASRGHLSPIRKFRGTNLGLSVTFGHH